MSPMKRSLYPADWEAISLRIRERAGWRCEWCGVKNGAIGYRDKSGKFWTDEELDRTDGDNPFVGKEPKPVKIVLTVMHLNHDTSDSSDGNLKAACQKCHLSYDAKYHAKNAATTRRREREKVGQITLVEAAP